MKGRIYIDLSSVDRYGAGFDELLRLIYEQPFHQKPALGSAPAFLKPDGGLPYTKELGAALRAIQEDRPNKHGLENLFIGAVLREVKSLYAEPEGNNYREVIYQAIQKTKRLRDQLSGYFETIAAFSGDDARALMHACRLLEGLGQNFGPPERNGSYYPGWVDTYAFVALESLLLLTAALLRHERWKLLNDLLLRTFIVRTDFNGQEASSYVVFDYRPRSLDEHRNRRLNLNRASLSADLLKERCSPELTPFAETHAGRCVSEQSSSTSRWKCSRSVQLLGATNRCLLHKLQASPCVHQGDRPGRSYEHQDCNGRGLCF
jgi:hypothetical protein